MKIKRGKGENLFCKRREQRGAGLGKLIFFLRENGEEREQPLASIFMMYFVRVPLYRGTLMDIST